MPFPFKEKIIQHRTKIRVFAITMAALLLLWFVSGPMQVNMSGSQELVFINQIKSGIDNSFKGKKNYIGLSNKTFFDTHSVPDLWVQGDISNPYRLQNLFGGIVVVEPMGGDKTAYRISYMDVPPLACRQLIPSLTRLFDTVIVNDKEVPQTSLSGTGRWKLCHESKNQFILMGFKS